MVWRLFSEKASFVKELSEDGREKNGRKSKLDCANLKVISKCGSRQKFAIIFICKEESNNAELYATTEGFINSLDFLKER